ncbi:hypothetical protein BJ138DRAFT_1159972 [Hygrophoropsis aurantiaca]|uniref:Uncharacterized protein n=1 Tax=Hygrophoropsis aurantiaca TaxID=72124 RepID=A0ACB8A420_9AGAM|nr:hypothetical protein BJ138DRAFT_1159972 [Hygrophoropsis aurantiaca]
MKSISVAAPLSRPSPNSAEDRNHWTRHGSDLTLLGSTIWPSSTYRARTVQRAHNIIKGCRLRCSSRPSPPCADQLSRQTCTSQSQDQSILEQIPFHSNTQIFRVLRGARTLANGLDSSSFPWVAGKVVRVREDDTSTPTMDARTSPCACSTKASTRRAKPSSSNPRQNQTQTQPRRSSSSRPTSSPRDTLHWLSIHRTSC